MLFNSIDFAIFLPIVFTFYWLLNKSNLKIQNLYLVIVSYIFYGWWDYRFLSLIFFSSIVDFTIGNLLKTEDKINKRKLLLLISIIINLSLLGFFKYFNFFIDNFTKVFSFFGYQFSVSRLKIILPVGISFYTFQTMSYTIDIYNKKLEPTNDIISFLAFVSFFPQLVAGPIERAINLLPQFYKRREFNYAEAVDGLRQALWGLFKKVAIADNCAYFVDLIYSNINSYSGSSLFIVTALFAVQIYCDFSGYSDIAIGIAKLFGFKLMKNFTYPYFSRDIAEFWRRWHISLTTWLRDYVYIPLGGSRVNKRKAIINTFIVFLLSGFWHGANWTYIFWGLINALYFIPLLVTEKNRRYLDIVAKDKNMPNFNEILSIVFTFILTCFAWIFFRANSMSHAFMIFKKIFSRSIIAFPGIVNINYFYLTILLIIIMFVLEWISREKEYGLAFVVKLKPIYRIFVYFLIFALIGLYMQSSNTPFIYFQF